MEKLANYIIAAPMDGVVLRQDGEVGEIAEAVPRICARSMSVAFNLYKVKKLSREPIHECVGCYGV